MLTLDVSGPLSGIVATALIAAFLLLLIWLFAWLKDVRAELRRIRKILQKRFPEEPSPGD